MKSLIFNISSSVIVILSTKWRGFSSFLFLKCTLIELLRSAPFQRKDQTLSLAVINNAKIALTAAFLVANITSLATLFDINNLHELRLLNKEKNLLWRSLSPFWSVSWNGSYMLKWSTCNNIFGDCKVQKYFQFLLNSLKFS